ncbi:hypothetical protein RF11_04496 [Thelohanellus kitauei]|uniref:Uncharacterized protein n=1 Tax=Thelohanellus kitauei TaxID=669202 RepID=A0A0C2MQP1_THEKT|nr:hypothetical protein RF11_04496 [Thelohanellus kitauei]
MYYPNDSIVVIVCKFLKFRHLDLQIVFQFNTELSNLVSLTIHIDTRCKTIECPFDQLFVEDACCILNVLTSSQNFNNSSSTQSILDLTPKMLPVDFIKTRNLQEILYKVENCFLLAISFEYKNKNLNNF